MSESHSSDLAFASRLTYSKYEFSEGFHWLFISVTLCEVVTAPGAMRWRLVVEGPGTRDAGSLWSRRVGAVLL